MNIFSNIGITELIVVLLLALLVVGPERLPELGQKLGKALRDVRSMYDNLTADLGPELASFQETTRELRESVDSVRSIPQDMITTVTKAADLEDTIGELKQVAEEVGQVSSTISMAGSIVKDPIKAAVSSAQNTLRPSLDQQEEPEPVEVVAALETPTDAGAGESLGEKPVRSVQAVERIGNGDGVTDEPLDPDHKPVAETSQEAEADTRSPVTEPEPPEEPVDDTSERESDG